MQRILTTGIREIDSNKFTECTANNDITNKPEFGQCLYGSTLIKGTNGSVCSDWSYFTQNDYTAKFFNYGISYKLHKSSKIAEIDTFDDYKKLIEKYQYDPGVGFKTALNFVDLSKDYDAFHLTYDGYRSLRSEFDIFFMSRGDSDDMFKFFKNHKDFYAYDAETWILFNLDCINKGSILNHDNVNSDGIYIEV